jgi:hypothetical protein
MKNMVVTERYGDSKVHVYLLSVILQCCQSKQHKTIKWLMNWEEFHIKWLWPNWGNIPAFA